MLNRFPDETECKAFAAALYETLGSREEGRRYWNTIPEEEKKLYDVEFVREKLRWGEVATASFSTFLKAL